MIGLVPNTLCRIDNQCSMNKSKWKRMTDMQMWSLRQRISPTSMCSLHSIDVVNFTMLMNTWPGGNWAQGYLSLENLLIMWLHVLFSLHLSPSSCPHWFQWAGLLALTVVLLQPISVTRHPTPSLCAVQWIRGMGKNGNDVSSLLRYSAGAYSSRDPITYGGLYFTS